MWSTEVKGKGERIKGKGGVRARRAAVRVLLALTLSPLPFALSGCRMDMQDQPKYKTFRAGDEKFGVRGASVRPLVEGTVPRQSGGPYRDREDYFYTGKTAALPGGGAQSGAQAGGVGAGAPNTSAGASSNSLTGASVTGNAAGGVPGAREAAATGGPDLFPFAIDRAALERGRERYQIFCVACHGATGEGDGMVVRRGFRQPPSYYDDRLQEGTTPAAHFFDVVTNGWGAMPSYAEQIPAEDRWKIIAYIRALQLSRRLKLNDLSPEEQQKVLRGAQRPAPTESGGPELQSTQPGGQPAHVEGNH
jgi:mono/diheme cytochrome c family protein